MLDNDSTTELQPSPRFSFLILDVSISQHWNYIELTAQAMGRPIQLVLFLLEGISQGTGEPPFFLCIPHAAVPIFQKSLALQKNKQKVPYTLLILVLSQFQDAINCKMPHHLNNTFSQVPGALQGQSINPANIGK